MMIGTNAVGRFVQPVLALALAVLIVAPLATAQADATDSRSDGYRTFSFKPRSDCRFFALTETAVMLMLSEKTKQYGDIGGYAGTNDRLAFSGDIGLMVNLDRRNALGISFFVGFGTNASGLGLRARYRRWLTRRLHFDVSPGLTLAGDFLTAESSYPAFAGRLAFGLADIVDIILDVKTIRVGYPVEYYQPRPIAGKYWTITRWYVGARLNSYPGLVGASVGVVVVLIASAGLPKT